MHDATAMTAAPFNTSLYQQVVWWQCMCAGGLLLQAPACTGVLYACPDSRAGRSWPEQPTELHQGVTDLIRPSKLAEPPPPPHTHTTLLRAITYTAVRCCGLAALVSSFVPAVYALAAVHAEVGPQQAKRHVAQCGFNRPSLCHL
jgi:hypothetical protein